MQNDPVTTKNIPFTIFLAILLQMEYKNIPFLVLYTYSALPHGQHKVRFLLNVLQKKTL